MDKTNDFYSILKNRKLEIEARYRDLTPVSRQRFEDAKNVLPGGYTRDAVIRNPYPGFVIGAHGAELVDADGRNLIDFCFNATSMPLGHSDPRVVEAVTRQVDGGGTSLQTMTGREIDLAAEVCNRISAADQIRFTNSGSEAVMLAIRLARGFTGRDIVLKFEGSYHGTYDDVQWSVSAPPDRTGPSGLPAVVPEAAGLTENYGRTVVLPYNDAETLSRWMAESGEQVASVLVEPMANRIGLVIPDLAFLEAARRACDSSGAVLIFDEVIAFRLGFGGAQSVVGVDPDITVLGKSIGGGFPVGGVAGRTEIMEITLPGRTRRVTHPGTFNGNPVTMAAGLATLKALTPACHDQLNSTADVVRQRLSALCEGLPLTVTGAGPLFKINATGRNIRDHRDTVTVDKEWESLASLALLNDGIMLTPSLRGCISLATTAGQTDAFVDAFAGLLPS